MLTRIGKKPNVEVAGPVEGILACHERIRRFSDLAIRLTTVSASSAEIADAAARVERYFRIALPLHVADEEASLRPRLACTDAAGEIARALEAMSAEHVTIDEALRVLVPKWAAIARDAARVGGWRSELLDLSQNLHAVFADHLANEEAHILPAMRRLPAADLDAIALEMRLRRTASPAPGS